MSYSIITKPHWVPIEELTFFGHKLCLKGVDIDGREHISMGKPEEDGTFKEWPYPEYKPTHYWSF